MKPETVLQIAVPAPLFRTFDYLVPDDVDPLALKSGCRVLVPFGHRTITGLIVDVVKHSELPLHKLKPIKNVIDTQPVLPADILDLLKWAASYYLHPIGDVMHTALPAILRQGKTAQAGHIKFWKIVNAHANDVADTLKRAPKQLQVYQLLLQQAEGMDENQLNNCNSNWRSSMKTLVTKNLVEVLEKSSLSPATTPVPGPVLNAEQQQTVDGVKQDLSNHYIHLVHGVTGSGKTEIYLELAKAVLDLGKQVLVLVPEISLTPQLTERFQQRLGLPIAVLHSALNDQQRLNAWLSAASSATKLVIGTRSAVFTPLPDLGLIIIDEEHDGSYKQQDGFRYNARDLALVRAQKQNIPVVLGSATPSFESLLNVSRKRFHIHKLYQRAKATTHTQVELIDLCRQPITEGLSFALISKIEQHLEQQSQVLLFLNRRGFSALLMCHECGWTTSCKRCDAHMTYHKNKKQIHCHHCGAEARAPEQCGECNSRELIALGLGTERIEHYLKERFPGVPVNRIDRDTTRKKGELQNKLAQAQLGEKSILVGTQMLAKGHDFPNVTLVGVLDTDQALYSSDFRATEHLAQLITQVSGRAGRGEKQGEVLIQTHHPDHPLLQTLLHKGYESFSVQALDERKQAKMPPHRHLAMLRCEAIHANLGHQFMREIRDLLNTIGIDTIDVFGPVPAPMEKRAGRHRSQIMLQSDNRKDLHNTLRHWLPQLQKLKITSKVRWSIDVDPYDTY